MSQRRFVLTVGTSSLRQLRELGRWGTVSKTVSDQLASPFASARATDAERGTSEVLRGSLSWLEPAAPDLQERGRQLRDADDDALRGLGAEAESLIRYARGENAAVPPFGDDDALYLLATDTVAGAVAACCVALLVGRTPKIQVVTERGIGEQVPFSLTSAPGAVDARVLIIEHLDTAEAGAIPRSSRALAHALLQASRAQSGEVPPDTVVAELSGGLKVTTSLMLPFLEYLGALRHSYRNNTPRSVQAWFRHEHAPRVWHQAGLRRLDAATLAAHRDEIEAAVEHMATPTDVLEGFAYLRTREGIEPTDVGYGLQVLLTPPAT